MVSTEQGEKAVTWRAMVAWAVPSAALVCALASPAALGAYVDELLGWSDAMFTLLAIVVGVSAALLAQLTARLTANRRWQWVSSMLWLYALFVLPSNPALGVHGDGNAAGARAVSMLLVVGFALLGVRHTWVPDRRTSQIAAVIGIGILAVVRIVAAASPRAGHALATSVALGTVMLVAAGCVACVSVVNGIRSGSAELTALGAGPGIVVFGHLRASGLGESPLPVLRLAGVVVIACSLVAVLSEARRSAERRVIDLESDLVSVAAARERLRRDVEDRDHELRNGLTGLAGLPELIAQPPSAPERGVLRNAVASELERLAAILDGGETAREHYRLQTLVADVVAVHASARTTTVVPPDLWVTGRRTATGQVLANLLVNCARHAPGAAVEVRAVRVGDRIRLEVRDDGPGVPPDQVGRLFERRVTDGEGTGLGLAISRRLLAAEGGSIAVEEPDGGGCRVVVDLPFGR